jgi:hypothetical protein
MFLCLALLIAQPCVSASALDAGQPAPCSGVLLSSDQVRDSLKEREELKVRRAFKCKACPACPACPPKPKTDVIRWAAVAFAAGALAVVAVQQAVD